MNPITSDSQIGSHSCPECHACGSLGHWIHRGLVDRLFGASGQWSLKQCNQAHCGLAWLDPMPFPDEIGKAYSQYYTHSSHVLTSHPSLAKRFYRLIKRGYLSSAFAYGSGSVGLGTRIICHLIYLFPVLRSGIDNCDIRRLNFVRDGKLLDVGCGAGEWLAFMQEQGWIVEGVDFDANAVQVARQSALKVALGSLEQQHYPAQSFDAVTLNHVIEHVPDPSGTLRECFRILKPGGTLFLATPNIGSWGHQLFQKNWRGLEPPRHLHIFSPSSLENLLKKAGFKRARVRTHTSRYVFYHSYRLREEVATGAVQLPSRLASRIVPYILNSFEQFRLLVTPTSGECIDALATKDSGHDSIQ